MRLITITQRTLSFDGSAAHFHVPVFWEGGNGLESTAEAITPAFLRAISRAGCEHFEVETYTFDVLPKELKRLSLAEMMVRELSWFQTRWEKSLVH